eukprot:TRINITY_DN5727_c0_g1_i2.p1 TRINITY_DN5727_c0_g1~~TRINITY_DN5727_c0_g1_i2.p1  ORF type:complete len:383 (+),score=48.88 TRINITY_DN5727_c0_g1_i2:228-1376(+)
MPVDDQAIAQTVNFLFNQRLFMTLPLDHPTHHPLRCPRSSSPVSSSRTSSSPLTLRRRSARRRHLDADNTVLIFDWDDTLMVTSWLNESGVSLAEGLVPPHIMRAICPLAGAVAELLLRAVRLGKVYIITNAESGWVEHSAERFFGPSVARLLPLVSGVMSARTEFEDVHPGSPCNWKLDAFALCIRDALGDPPPVPPSPSPSLSLDPCPSNSASVRSSCSSIPDVEGTPSEGLPNCLPASPTPSSGSSLFSPPRVPCIVSVGDSVFERASVLWATRKQYPQARTKAVKLLEWSPPDLLARQILLLADRLEEIILFPCDADILLEPDWELWQQWLAESEQREKESSHTEGGDVMRPPGIMVREDRWHGASTVLPTTDDDISP